MDYITDGAPDVIYLLADIGWDSREDKVELMLSLKEQGYSRFWSDGVIRIEKTRCVGCFTCVLVCPYGALAPSEEGVMQKCELCLSNASGEPACVRGCPNRAIVYEER